MKEGARSLERRELKSKQMDLLSVNEKLERSFWELSMKTEQLITVQKEVEKAKRSVVSWNEQLEQKEKGLALVNGLIRESSDLLYSKETQLERIRTMVSQQTEQLEWKKKHCHELKETINSVLSDLELKKRELASVDEELKSKEKQLKSIEMSISEKRQQCNEEICLLTLVDDNMVDQELMPHEVLSALQATADPAKFVLDLMPGGLLQCTGNANTKSKVLMMEKLIEVCPIISPEVKTEAQKLAVLWKAKLTSETENSAEVWGFLLFLAAYGLVGCFKRDEIIKLVVDSADQKHSPDICRFFGFTDKIPEIIGALMERKKYRDAARFSCSFELLHTFKLENILVNWVEHIKGKAVDEEIGAFKAIQQCIAEFKLESTFDVPNLVRHLRELEMQKQGSK